MWLKDGEEHSYQDLLADKAAGVKEPAAGGAGGSSAAGGGGGGGGGGEDRAGESKEDDGSRPSKARRVAE